MKALDDLGLLVVEYGDGRRVHVRWEGESSPEVDVRGALRVRVLQQPSRDDAAPEPRIEGLAVHVGFEEGSQERLVMQARVVGAGTSAPYVRIEGRAAEAFARGLEHLARCLRSGGTVLPVESAGEVRAFPAAGPGP